MANEQDSAKSKADKVPAKAASSEGGASEPTVRIATDQFDKVLGRLPTATLPAPGSYWLLEVFKKLAREN